MAEKLYAKAVELVGPVHDKVIYDLIAVRDLSIAWQKSQRSYRIELSADAAYDARNNATLNGLENITIFTGPLKIN